MTRCRRRTPSSAPCASRSRHATGARRSRTAGRQRGIELRLGFGLGQGYATLGAIGWDARSDYAAIGTVTALAARLCEEAAPGEILISQRLCAAVEALVEIEPAGERALRGFLRPVPAFRVRRLRVAEAAVGRRGPAPSARRASTGPLRTAASRSACATRRGSATSRSSSATRSGTSTPSTWSR